MTNRSVPADVNVAAAIEWLTHNFGFVERYRYGDPAQGAQMHLGGAWIMLTLAREGRAAPAQTGVWTQSLAVLEAR